MAQMINNKNKKMRLTKKILLALVVMFVFALLFSTLLTQYAYSCTLRSHKIVYAHGDNDNCNFLIDGKGDDYTHCDPRDFYSNPTDRHYCLNFGGGGEGIFVRRRGLGAPGGPPDQNCMITLTEKDGLSSDDSCVITIKHGKIVPRRRYESDPSTILGAFAVDCAGSERDARCFADHVMHNGLLCLNGTIYSCDCPGEVITAFGNTYACGDDYNWHLREHTEEHTIIEICVNKRDDDGDGLVDCQDPDCKGYIKVNYICEYPHEITCNDGFDNDENGFADCEDDYCKAHYEYCRGSSTPTPTPPSHGSSYTSTSTPISLTPGSGSLIFNYSNPFSDLDNFINITKLDKCDSVDDGSNFFYCGTDGKWHRDEDNLPRYAKYVPEDVEPPTDGSYFGCCHEDQCWDGLECVDAVTIGTATELDKYWDQYFCIDNGYGAEWTKLGERYFWTLAEKGYCPATNDEYGKALCYLGSSTNPCVSSYTIVNDDRNIDKSGVHMCYDGVWISRPLYAAIVLSSIGKSMFNDYTIYCDVPSNIALTSAYSGYGYYACIMVGHSGDQEKRYLAIVTDNTNLDLILSDLGVGCDFSSAPSTDTFVYCTRDAYRRDVWYNPLTGVLVYGEISRLPSYSSLWNSVIVKSAHQAYIELLSKLTFTFHLPFLSTTISARPNALVVDIRKVFDSERLYMFSKGDKTIIGYLEEDKIPKDIEVSNMVVKYQGYDPAACQYVSRYAISHENAPNCFNLPNGFIVAKISNIYNFNIEDYWNEITSKLRPK